MSRLLTQISQDNVQAIQEELALDVAEQALESESIEVQSANDLVVRSILPQHDLDSGSENAWSSDAEWRQDWSSSGSGTSWNEAYQIDSNARAGEKVIAIYGIMSLDATVETRQIRFRGGSSGSSGVKAWVDVEPMEADDESKGILDTPVVYHAKEHGQIEHWIENATDGQRINLLGLVAEPIKEVVSHASNPFLGQDSQGNRTRFGSFAPILAAGALGAAGGYAFAEPAVPQR